MALYRMYPTQHFCSFPLYGTGYGWHLAAGSSGDTVADCFDACNDLAEALDETGYGFARSSATAGQVNKGRAEFTFTDPPQNVTIVSVTLVAWMRTSNAGAAIIDSTPTVRLFNYVSTGARVYQTGTQSVTAARNRNTQSPTGSFQKLTYTWTTKPAGGAWTRAELLAGAFKAGFESDATAGNGSGVDATTGGSSASMDWASVYLELETTPSGIYAESVRTAASHLLRLLSRPLRTFRVDVPAQFGAIEPGRTIWSSHDVLPWSPGSLSWEQVPLYLLEVEEQMSPRQHALTFLDLRDQFASFWSPFRITGIDDQNSGLAMIHRGGSWATTRNQVAYGQRPGDGLYQQVAVDKPLLTKDGLLIQGGSDKNEMLSSTFSQGSGDTFTSWTKTTTGSATVTQDILDYLVDVGGFRRSSVYTTTAVGEAASLSQAVASVAANTKLRVRIWHKKTSGADPLQWQLVRNVGGTDNWWNEGSASWQGASIWNSIDASSSIARMTSTEIDTGGSISTITLAVGFSAGDTTAASVGRIYSAELQRFTDAGSSVAQWFRRDILPTTTTAVTREKDQTVVRNFPDSRVWSASRGYFRASLKLQFAHSELTSVFGVVMGTFDLYYVKTNATTGAWIFSNGYGSAQFATSLAAVTLPAANTAIVVACRWTSAAEDEHGVSGQSLAIWINGVKGGTVATGLAEPSPAADDEITLGNDPGTTLTTPLDGVLYDVVIDGRCPTDDEMARM